MATIEGVENILQNIEGNCEEFEKTVDHYLIAWTINDILKMSEIGEQSVASPPFQIHSESWVMIVYPEILRSNKKVLKFCLRKEDKGTTCCSIIVTYRFGIKKHQDITWFKERRKISFSSGSDDTIVCCIPEFFKSVDELKVSTLTVVCEMYVIYNAEEQSIPSNQETEDLDLHNLSLELLNRYEKALESDVLIRRKNFEDIPAHKAIISIRSPAFAKLIKASPTSSIEIPEEDYDHIQNILTYIYSGRFHWLAISGVGIGLYECAQRYQLESLTHLLSPSKIRINSAIKEYNINFSWKIENFSTLNMKPGECQTSEPLHVDCIDSPTWYLDIYPEGCTKTQNTIGIFVRMENFKNNTSVKLCVSILDEFDNEHCQKRSSESLCPNLTYKFPDFVTKEELNRRTLLREDKLVVNCKICYGIVSHSFDETNIISQSSCFRYPCLEQLSADLKKLLEKGDFSDAVLAGDSAVFRVHKFIMSSRSAVLDLLFKTAEDKDRVIKMASFSSSVIEAFITYAYTGKWTENGKRLVVKMYALAKQYNVISLASSSSIKIVQTLDSKCVCNVILLANRYKENLLMIKCLDYLKKTGKEILKSTEWKALLKKDKKLALKIDKWLQNPGNDIPNI